MKQLELNQIQEEAKGSSCLSPLETSPSSSLKKCIDCKEEFEIKKGEEWKIRCIKCYIKMKNSYNKTVDKPKIIINNANTLGLYTAVSKKLCIKK